MQCHDPRPDVGRMPASMQGAQMNLGPKEQPVLVGYNQRLEDSIATLDRALARLGNVADRMLGSVPVAPTALGRDAMPGTLGELDHRLRLLAERLNELHTALDRIESI